MTDLPPDLQGLWNDAEAADARADALSSRLPDEEFFWQPDGGRRWSVALCLDHLAVANATYGGAVREAVETAKARGWTRRGPATPGFFGRKFAELMEPPPKRRTRAPARIQPQPSRTREAILAAFRDAHDMLRRTIQEGATVDLNRATFANPFISFIRVSASTGLFVISAHDRRHLWQAEQVEREIRARGAR